MKRFLQTTAICTLAIPLCMCNSHNSEPCSETPTLNVSAAFAGVSHGQVIMAGGCNFPVNPLEDGSTKVYYDGIYTINNDTAQIVGRLPKPLAYGFSATTPLGVVMGGGNGVVATSPTGKEYSVNGNSDVWLVTLADNVQNESASGRREQNANKVTLTPLPSLPCAIDNASACAIGNVVYVAGGNHDGVATNSLLRLDDTGWHTLPPFPGNARTQPVLAAAHNENGEECVWLFGGFAGIGETATLDCDGYVFIPSRGEWEHVDGPVDESGIPLCVAGGAACTLSDGRIMVTGGVNKDIFLSALRQQAPDYLHHPKEWYRFNHRVLVFNPQTRQWSITSHNTSTARAGASLVPLQNNSAILMGGELKPRIRTAEKIILHI